MGTQSLQVQIICFDIDDLTRFDAGTRSRDQGQFQGLYNRYGNLVLNGKNVTQFMIIGL
jgi:hypothetical protein